MRDTCGIHAGYMRDTCICKGDQDTCEIHPRYIMRYMYLKCILRATYLRCRIHAGYMRDTYGIHVSARVIKIHAGYIRDTWCDTCISNVSWELRIWVAGYMPYTCLIHALYMRDTCNLRGNQDTCGIHARFIRGTCGIHAGHVSRGFGGKVGLEIRILTCIPMYPTRIVSVSCMSCIWGLRYIVS